jgi:hypothetical protein
LYLAANRYTRLDYQATKVSTKRCDDVYDFSKEVKKEMPNLFGSYALAQISIILKKEELAPGCLLSEIDFTGNDSLHPLFIRVSRTRNFGG